MADSLSRKTLPSNPDAERQVLGAILTDSKAMDLVAPILSSEDFYIPKHQKIYEAALSIYADKDAVDTTTVSAKLPASKATVEELADGIRATTNVDSHARLIKAAADKRNILDVANRLASMAYDKELEEVRTFAKSAVTEILTNTDERKKLLTPDDQIELLYELIKQRREQGGPISLSTGYKRLDGYIDGFKPGDLIVLAARTSVGKSSFAENLAENVAEQGKPVLYVSVEMEPIQMVYRFAKRWGLSPSVLEHGADDERSRDSLDQLVRQRRKLPLYIENAPAASTVEIRAYLNQLQAEVGEVSLVVVDYLQLMTDTFGGRLSENLRLGLITKTLKQMAREYGLTIVLIVQLNRDSDKRGVLPEPRLSDIRESGRIEEDADVVLMLWREREPDFMGNDTHLKVEKNRQGAMGTVPIVFNKPTFSFTEPTNAQLAQRPVREDDDEPTIAGFAGIRSTETRETTQEEYDFPPEDGY